MIELLLKNKFKLSKPFSKNTNILSKKGNIAVKIAKGNRITDTNGTTITFINGLNKLNSKLELTTMGKLARNDINDINNSLKK